MSAALGYVALGSNLGDRAAHLAAARAALADLDGVTLLRVSAIHETPPLGPPQPSYLNQVVEIEAHRAPEALLADLKAWERAAGRVPGERWGPRIIDLDLLVLGDAVRSTPALTLPHPGMAHRRFVLAPLAELRPDLIPPGWTETIAERLTQLPPDAP